MKCPKRGMCKQLWTKDCFLFLRPTRLPWLLRLCRGLPGCECHHGQRELAVCVAWCASQWPIGVEAVHVGVQSKQAPISEVPLSYLGHWSQTLVHGTLGSHRESIRGLVAPPAPFSCRAAYITVKPCLVCIKRFWKSISVKYHIKYSTGKKTTNLVKCSPFQPWTQWMQRTFLWSGYHFFQERIGGWGSISLSWHPE